MLSQIMRRTQVGVHYNFLEISLFCYHMLSSAEIAVLK